MNDGEDEKGEPRSHAMVFIHRPGADAGAVGRCRGFHRSKVKGKHLLLVAKGTWAKNGRNQLRICGEAGRQRERDGQEDEDRLIIMDSI